VSGDKAFIAIENAHHLNRGILPQSGLGHRADDGVEAGAIAAGG